VIHGGIALQKENARDKIVDDLLLEIGATAGRAYELNSMRVGVWSCFIYEEGAYISRKQLLDATRGC
jgi:hypothetical protein